VAFTRASKSPVDFVTRNRLMAIPINRCEADLCCHS
jgi:hypothetical protein